MTKQNGNNGTHSWSNLAQALGGSATLEKFNNSLRTDEQFVSFVATDALTPFTFGIASTNSQTGILVNVGNSSATATTGSPSEAEFVLTAPAHQWAQHFVPEPKAPFQSYWGMLSTRDAHSGVAVVGSDVSFAQHAHLWRRALELLKEAYCGPIVEGGNYQEADYDYVQGRYIYVNVPLWGKCKIHVESSGEGRQSLILLHTAGADSRQWHGVMNDSRMRKLCSMYAFDVPGHGRSFAPPHLPVGGFQVTEDAYLASVAGVIKRLGLHRPIICGMGMGAAVCLAIAARSQEIGAAGAIAVQGGEVLGGERHWHDKSPYVNQALFAPEWVYGMTASRTPQKQKALLHQILSSQPHSTLHADLHFLSSFSPSLPNRFSSINTGICPVYFLTGDNDWTVTPQAAQAIAKQIPGATHVIANGFGGFPATENPKEFSVYLEKAVEQCRVERKNSYDISVLRMTDD